MPEVIIGPVEQQTRSVWDYFPKPGEIVCLCATPPPEPDVNDAAAHRLWQDQGGSNFRPGTYGITGWNGKDGNPGDLIEVGGWPWWKWERNRGDGLWLYNVGEFYPDAAGNGFVHRNQQYRLDGGAWADGEHWIPEQVPVLGMHTVTGPYRDVRFGVPDQPGPVILSLGDRPVSKCFRIEAWKNWLMDHTQQMPVPGPGGMTGPLVRDVEALIVTDSWDWHDPETYAYLRDKHTGEGYGLGRWERYVDGVRVQLAEMRHRIAVPEDFKWPG